MPTPIQDAAAMVDLEKLRQDAMAATQGRWRLLLVAPNNMDRGTAMVATPHTDGMAIDCMDSGATYGDSAANASHIANISPSTALALIEAVTKAPAVADMLEQMLLAEIDYMTRNKLGDPAGQHSQRFGWPALTALREALKPFTKE